jgi:magnesium transporter
MCYNYCCMKNHVHEIKKNGFTWVNITKPNDEALNEIAEKFDLETADVKACLPPLQRPKLIHGPNYLFMILLFPVFNRETKEIESTEVDFFIGKNFFITVHNNSLLPMRKTFEKFEKHRIISSIDIGRLMVSLLTGLLQYCYPILNHISQDIDIIEKKVFETHNQKVTFEIMRLKTNVVEFKSNTGLHNYVINKLINFSTDFFDKKTLDHLSVLIEDTEEIRASLDNYSETIYAINDTHQSLINLRANEIMKNLQIFAVIVFPLTLLAAIFGMNTLGNMPFFDHPNGFWIIAGIMLASTFTMLIFFKWRKWY